MTVFFRFWLFGLFFILSFSATAQVVDTAAVVREVDSLIQVSRGLTAQGAFEQALEVNAVAEKRALEALGRESAAYGSCCFNRGRVQHFADNYQEAETWYLESKSIREKVYGKEHPDYASSLYNLAVLYRDMGRYAEAEPLDLESKSIREKVLGKDHADYASSLDNLAVLYGEMGRYAEAEPLYLESKSIRGKMFGKEHPDYASSLNNLAILYNNMGRYAEAQPLYLESKSILKKKAGKDHPQYASSLHNLAALYYDMGRYAEAESLHLECKSIVEKTLGKDHRAYASSLNGLAVLYRVMGRYTEAEPLYLESKSIREKTLGKEHPEYASSLNSLASLYYSMGRYAEAEPLYLESKSIKGKTLGKEHPNYANSLNNLASLYSKMGRYAEAEPLFLETKSIRGKTLGKEHPDYASSLYNLAVLYRDMGRYAEAEPLDLESKSIREKVLGKDHADYAASLNNLANLYSAMGRYAEVEPLMDTTEQAVHKILTSAVQFSSEKNLEDYLAQENPKLATIPSYLLSGQFSGRMNQIAYDDALFQKGFLQNAARRLNILAAATPEADSLFKRLQSYRFLLSKEYAKPIVERRNVAEMEEKANALEGRLARSVAGFAQALQQVKWNEVQAALRPGEAAIEFLHFPVLFPKQADSTMYAALLLRPGDTKPEFVALFEEKQLQSLLEKTGDNARLSTALYAARSGEVLDAAPAYGAELYNLIWRPLDSLLQKQGIKTVYFSPSGLLHRVAFAALPVPPFRGGRGVLSDKYALHQLGSTRSLVVKTPQPVAKDYTAAVFGGVQYDRNAALPADSTLAEITDNRLWNLMERPRNSGDAGFDYLPGTQQEANLLQQLLQQSRVRVQTHTGAQATEEALKTLGRDTVKSPDILHIATHGFFFPDPEKRKEQRFGEENVFKWNENPLFRSGLAFAGANAAWSGQPTPGHIEDGIATAYEISHLNLSNTKLAVLSACQTGLGDIKGSEGVYGLQRAFKMAGVDYLLVSLWQVPDQETAEFMDVFYKTWLGGKTIHEAFAKAQKKMRKKYKEVYKWGAWVLVE